MNQTSEVKEWKALQVALRNLIADVANLPRNIQDNVYRYYERDSPDTMPFTHRLDFRLRATEALRVCLNALRALDFQVNYHIEEAERNDSRNETGQTNEGEHSSEG